MRTSKHIFKCACGKSIEVELIGVGGYNVGEAEQKTGWEYGSCEYTSREVWMCPTCTSKAKELAKELFKLTGTPYYYWATLIDKNIVNEWRNKQK